MNIIDDIIKEAKWIGKIASKWNLPSGMKRVKKIEEMLDELKKQIDTKTFDKKFFTKVKNLLEKKLEYFQNLVEKVLSEAKEDSDKFYNPFYRKLRDHLGRTGYLYLYLSPPHSYSYETRLKKVQEIKKFIESINNEEEFLADAAKEHKFTFVTNEDEVERGKIKLTSFVESKSETLEVVKKYEKEFKPLKAVADLMLEAEKLKNVKLPKNVYTPPPSTAADVNKVKQTIERLAKSLRANLIKSRISILELARKDYEKRRTLDSQSPYSWAGDRKIKGVYKHYVRYISEWYNFLSTYICL